MWIVSWRYYEDKVGAYDVRPRLDKGWIIFDAEDQALEEYDRRKEAAAHSPDYPTGTTPMVVLSQAAISTKYEIREEEVAHE